MFDLAKQSEKEIIYRLWKEYFSFDDFGYTDYFFKYQYDLGKTYVIRENNEIVSCLHVAKHPIMLNDILVSSSYIVGVITVKEYQNKGYMHQLFNHVLDILSRQDLITYIQGYEPDIYKMFDFNPTYYKNKYVIKRENMKMGPTSGVVINHHSKDMLRVHEKFMQKFDGYLVRNEQYYNALQKRITSQNGYSLMCYDVNNQPLGYALVTKENKRMIIDEICYLDIATLSKLLSMALMTSEEVILYSSASEALFKVFPNLQAEKEMFAMVRINDLRLYQKLYNNHQIKMGRKPLWFNEYA
ncbi:MAG: GNAT family N-acetyltransferase [Erysipelotrichaceae bacterium]